MPGVASDAPIPGVDPTTGAVSRATARELLWWLLDSPVFRPAVTSHPDPLRWEGYDAAQRSAQATTGADESVMVARGFAKGTRQELVVVAWDFRFLGGSMGSAAGEMITDAYEYATKERLAIALLPSTGGARMQEGMASLVQMAKTADAARAHADAGLFQFAVLRDPTTGGVFASHASLADLVAAEAGATIGFAGPRVAAALTGGQLPRGSHTAEGAYASGLIDGVLPRQAIPVLFRSVATWLTPSLAEPVPAAPDGPRMSPGDTWTQVQRARDPRRARADAYLDAFGASVELRGDRAGMDDPAVRVALARTHGRSIVLIAMDRNGADGRITPAGYRKVWRGLRLADRLQVPVVTLIDTPGADASADSEAGGIAHHIAQTLVELLRVRSPTVAIVTGEGGSGGALALAVTDRLLIQEHAIFSVIAPEGAAAILARDAARAPEFAAQLDPTAQRLVALRIADATVPEPAGAEVAAVVAAACARLDELAGQDWASRQKVRHRRWRQVAGA